MGLALVRAFVLEVHDSETAGRVMMRSCINSNYIKIAVFSLMVFFAVKGYL